MTFDGLRVEDTAVALPETPASRDREIVEGEQCVQVHSGVGGAHIAADLGHPRAEFPLLDRKRDLLLR